jgi:hypothetical protein
MMRGDKSNNPPNGFRMADGHGVVVRQSWQSR